MKTLQPPDNFHLRAAQGWVELGNHKEAWKELEEIRPEFRAHPDVLQIRWTVYAFARDWKAGVEICEALIKLESSRPEPWIHRSFALHELKRTQEALEKLLPAVHIFPNDWTIPYNLACYTCQLGKLKDAMTWLEKAIDFGGKTDVRQMALEDSDLEPLWANIGEI
jgi:tetratricopeptide (TPR) repeat protein